MSTTKTAFTPGPWEVDSAKDGGCRYFQIDAPTPKELTQKPAFGYTVADTMNRHYCITPEEDEGNARLISTAPDGQALAQHILALLQGHPEWEAFLNEAQALIKKAGGQ